jgi:hypothetical protein
MHRNFQWRGGYRVLISDFVWLVQVIIFPCITIRQPINPTTLIRAVPKKKSINVSISRSDYQWKM